MKLGEHLTETGQGFAAFGRRIGVKSPETVRRYCLPPEHKDYRHPRPAIMARIDDESGGEVPPESFYPGYKPSPSAPVVATTADDEARP